MISLLSLFGIELWQILDELKKISFETVTFYFCLFMLVQNCMFSIFVLTTDHTFPIILLRGFYDFMPFILVSDDIVVEKISVIFKKQKLGVDACFW